MCIVLSLGTYSSGGTRQMASGANLINAELYSDAGLTTIWPSSIASITTAPLTFLNLSATAQTVNVYGAILAAQQSATPGAYTTTITATPYYVDGTTSTACSTMTTTFATTTFNVTGTIISTCNAATAGNLSFPQSSILSSNVDATSSLSVVCTKGTPYNIRLDNGLTGTGPTQRKMSFSGSSVTYGLYTNNARTSAWGSTDGTNTNGGTGTAAAQNYTVYGRVPPQVTPRPGTYSDTVTATVSF